jgi:ribosomal protein L32
MSAKSTKHQVGEYWQCDCRERCHYQRETECKSCGKTHQAIGVCQQCGMEEVNYTGNYVDEDNFRNYYTCGTCGFRGVEVFELVFAGNKGVST